MSAHDDDSQMLLSGDAGAFCVVVFSADCILIYQNPFPNSIIMQSRQYIMISIYNFVFKDARRKKKQHTALVDSSADGRVGELRF